MFGRMWPFLEDSRDAQRYVRGAEPYSKNAKPDLIILDYRPPLDGGLALSELKGDLDFAHLRTLKISSKLTAGMQTFALRSRWMWTSSLTWFVTWPMCGWLRPCCRGFSGLVFA